MGLVKRSMSATDGRARQVGLTPHGRRLVLNVLKGHDAQIESVLGGLQAVEQQVLMRMLQKMVAHLENLVEHSTSRDRLKAAGDS
jgi:DNA-binding MarR family transcriptional regulator